MGQNPSNDPPSRPETLQGINNKPGSNTMGLKMGFPLKNDLKIASKAITLSRPQNQRMIFSIANGASTSKKYKVKIISVPTTLDPKKHIAVTLASNKWDFKKGARPIRTKRTQQIIEKTIKRTI